MAVLTLETSQVAAGRHDAYKTDARLRIKPFDLPAVEVAGDANSYVELVRFGGGLYRILPALSRLKVSAFGSSRTLDIGHLAYEGLGGDTVAEVIDCLVDGLDVSSAVALAALSAVPSYDLASRGDIVIAAKVLGGTIPVGATINGWIAYLPNAG